ncbi:MAG TPA: hypothetical protein PKA33_18990 [Amaricoccus sp.]|uniref:hypothetical protein n=1 Tax=Amaricoccus sp. TaxID=1872485 RepID=UPI002C1002CF|nr:hypothetical protein [Amaricoccus sp.]HMQ64750.1 hypothetical protein [Arachnia sp.]HMR54406.1 hypothetical protein [Amaricoccus sp.]HMR62198.1 hypothetical protein [Amaricoccus sp.]HMU01428.1 hypothetical protein [Amaricoccus sp.]
MPAKFTISAVASAFAATASAAPFEPPYALSAVHADFQSQLEQAADMPGEIGTAARAAADLLGPHNAAEEEFVLPFLGFADAATVGGTTDPQLLEQLASLEAELPQLRDSDLKLVTALVELYAAAEEAGQAEVARLAERMVWHEVSDIEVLYPAAVLVGSAVQGQTIGTEPATILIGPGLYGQDPVPMMGVGNPHAPGASN